MGGRGSGRWRSGSRRARTDEAMPLRVAEILRVLAVERDRRLTGSSRYGRYGPMNLVVDATERPVRVHLRWELEGLSLAPGEADLWLVSTEPYFGGERWWFICPPCGRRCGVLYFSESHSVPWACRTCLGLAYSSQGEGKPARLTRRLRMVLGKAGGAYKAQSGMGLRVPRPRGMHNKTYRGLLGEADRLFFDLASTKSGRARLKRMWN